MTGATEVEVEAAVRTHVHALASDIGERNVYRPAALHAAARYVTDAWTAMGFAVRRQPFEVEEVACENLEVEIAGRSSEIVLLGAHYDTVEGSPGADDNASGVAALLEVSRRLQGARMKRTLRFVAFANEEPPWFQTTDMGSRVYAAAARKRGDGIVAMVSLESLGWYSDAPGSQQYPPGAPSLLPDVGNFVAVVGNLDSQLLVGKLAHALSGRIPVESLATYASVPGVGWSDHESFWVNGYPGAMLTDTAPFRNPHYHTAGDTVDRVCYDRLAAVTLAVLEATRALGK